jgi:hypothetical protein
MVCWDPDGPGPLPQQLVIGGYFLTADSVPARCVAAWDGRQWRGFGEGLFATSSLGGSGVTSLLVHNGELYASGIFALTSGGTAVPQVAKWNGVAWVAVGTPFSGGSINALASFAGDLWVGGRFSAGGGANLVRLSGNAWAGFGNGTIEMGTQVDSLAVRGDSLLIGGVFAGTLVQLDSHGLRSPVGTSPFSIVPNGSITSFATDGDDIYVAGDFRLLDGSQPGVMHYDGAMWTAMASPTTAQVRRVAKYNSAVYLSAGTTGVPTDLLRWDGATWVTVNPEEQFASSDTSIGVRILGIYQDHLILGGSFSGLYNLAVETDIPRVMFSLAMMDANETIAPMSRGLGARVSSFTEFQGHTIATGRFTSIGPVSGGRQSAGRPGRLAQMDDDGFWVPFPGGLPDNNTWCSATWSNQLVVGGEPFNVGSVTNAVVAAWDGSQWHDMSAGALNFPVSMVTAGDELWASFVTATPLTEYSHLAVGRWNGTGWDIFTSQYGYLALTAIGSEVYVSDGIEQRILRWNGAAFENLPLPTGAVRVRVIGVFQGDLVALGSGNVDVMYRWNGSAWSKGVALLPGTILPATQSLGRSVESHGVMYLGSTGYEGSAGIEKIYSWDGYAWGNLGVMYVRTLFSSQISFSGSVRPPSLVRHGDDEIFVGGTFLYARFRNNTFGPAGAFFARIVTPERLATVAAPSGVITAYAGRSIEFEWEFASPATSYSWGVPSSIGTVSGRTSSRLRIDNLLVTSGVTITCTASDGCQTFSLPWSTLVVLTGCDTDFNKDGNSDAGDIDYMIDAVAGGENPTNADLDFNTDGNVDSGDIDALINAIAGGGCP